MSSLVALKPTVLPTMTGMRMLWMSSSKMRPRTEREMWRAVVTVDWTTKRSAPASTAMGASFLVLAGVRRLFRRRP
jgi:hypothetical protein